MLPSRYRRQKVSDKEESPEQEKGETVQATRFTTNTSGTTRHETPVRSNVQTTVDNGASMNRDGPSHGTEARTTSRNNGPQHILSMPPIYAAPTVDTLDDESNFLNPHFRSPAESLPNQSYASNYNKKNRYSKLHDDEQSGVMRHHVSFTPTSIASGYSFHEGQYSYHHTAHSPTRKSQVKSAKDFHTTGNGGPTKKHTRRKKGSIQYHRDFQREEDFMAMTIRQVNIAQRSAFEARKALPAEEWHIMAHRLEARNRSSVSASSSSSSLPNAHRKISPSLQHLKLLRALQSVTTIRQLSFSPSVGIDSDIFMPWWEDAISTSYNCNHENIASQKKLRRRLSSIAEQRDGRYRSIQPVQATLSALPSVPPALSNKKTRLPMRSDVGFPHPTGDEIRQKQAEINQETTWEEASPRIVVLVTSDDLGTAVQEDDHGPAIQLDHWEWNGGGLQGMPWAGRDLLRAKELNALHFSRKTSVLSEVLRGNLQGEPQSDRATVAKKRLLEPNRTSTLAPPLDASYSKTLGWRSRPYHDRPPGMEYLLCWPLDVSFDVGDIEPFLCSLTLYNLPKDDPGDNNAVYGKISEDFWFPAGDWDGKFDLEPSFLIPPTSNPNTFAFEEDVLETWCKRKQKAIFSYDPLAISGGAESLFWVIQVFKVANNGSTALYINEKCASKTSKRSTSVKTLLKGKSPVKSKSDSYLEQYDDPTTMEKMSVNNFFDKFGTTLMMPLAFGMKPVMPDASETRTEFPKGAVLDLSMFPAVSESQEDFVDRLSKIARGSRHMDHNLDSAALDGEMFTSWSSHAQSNTFRPSHASDTLDSGSVASTASASDHLNIETKAKASPSRKKKSIAKRIWKSPAKASRTLKSACSSSATSLPPKSATSGHTSSNRPKHNHGYAETSQLAATASVFSTALSPDWLQSLLAEPTDTDGFKFSRYPCSDTIAKVPRILCDVSGDFAVMLEERGGNSKRSNLVRLAANTKPAGYICSSEIREVLFLPARPEKQYDLDMPPSNRSLLNLLYLYPRLLRSSSEHKNASKLKKGEVSAKYSIRVRLVKSSLEFDETGKLASSNAAIEAFHNPAPWRGSPLLKEVYTKVSPDLPSSKHDKRGAQEKIEHTLKDEFKLRLPEVLDGSFFIHFTLFELEESKHDKIGISLRAVGESSIPLSSSSARDAAGGMKVATVIPNGCHRIKLGDFRFYIESRLVSSIHIGDAAVSAAIRDFPSVDAKQSDLAPSSSKIPESSSVQEAYSSIGALLANASGGTLVGHFPILLYAHLKNLVNTSAQGSAYASPGPNKDFMMKNLSSFFIVLRKIKARLYSDYELKGFRNIHSRRRIDSFFKKIIDEFDENFLLISGDSGSPCIDEDQASELGSEVELLEAYTNSSAAEASADNELLEKETLDEGVVRVRHMDSLRDGIEKRLIKRKSRGGNIESAGSLSRIAYGASKTDKLKIEAELYYDAGRFNHYFEDDETIMTSGTTRNASGFWQKPLVDSPEAEATQNGSQNWAINANQSNDEFISDTSIRAAADAANRVIKDQKSASSTHHEDGFGMRKIKTVANVMLACGASNGISPRRLSLDCSRSSRRRRNSSSFAAAQTKKQEALEDSEKVHDKKEAIILPGSDDEVENRSDGDRSNNSHFSGFRGYHNGNPIGFSCILSNEKQIISGEFSGGKYIYESILVLWLHVWSGFAQNVTDGELSIPLFDESYPENIALYDFFQNIDILLPLCLKSLALRCFTETGDSDEPTTKVVLDSLHMSFLQQVVGVLACCVMGQALTLSKSGKNAAEARNASLLQALVSSEFILDFIEGLFALLHPEHMRCLIARYFCTLGECEINHLKANKNGLMEFRWTTQSIHRVKSSRQLRIRAIERLAVLPSFLALNFPPKFSERRVYNTTNFDGNSTWKVQYVDILKEASSGGFASQPGNFGENGDKKRPESGWLARLLAREALSICATSCEAVVAEAMAQIEFASHGQSQNRPSLQLDRGDLLMFQSLAIHSITAFYELVLRRHAMDKRFQTDTCRGRIASLYAECLFGQSLQSVRWLARMESTHKVRSLWMLCLVYVLQEAPEILIRDLVRSYCDPSDMLIHRFIRLLRLSSSTFQSFVDQPRHSTFPNEIDEGISPWLLQESFNTICATTNVVVEECVKLTEPYPKEQTKMIHAVLDLFLHILTTPQSAVTHLRAVGGALQALEQFGAEIFLDVVGTSLQHWIRVVQSLMNSTSLSVRSISVDFALSLLGSAYDLLGSVDDILLVFVSVLPEVVAREMALYSVDGHVKNLHDLERSIWPLRRSFSELEDANPLDDERIDPELSPVLRTFCRASQAVLDGVLVELRLKKHQCVVVGTLVEVSAVSKKTFDADEESLVEAADFFLPEVAPMQRLRWLQTLKRLHEEKGQWLEAAETLIACANTISDSIPHLQCVWRPSPFLLWSDPRRSTWLSTVGEDMGHPDRGNAAVMAFAEEFLEPSSLLKAHKRREISGKLEQPTVPSMCLILTLVAKEAVQFYLREDNVDEVAYSRLESLLCVVMNVLGRGSFSLDRSSSLQITNPISRKQQVEEEAALRRVSATLSSEMTSLAERLLLLVQEDSAHFSRVEMQQQANGRDPMKRPLYVYVAISGAKPSRFKESTTIPTFLDWNMPCVCRVPGHLVRSASQRAGNDFQKLKHNICMEYGKPLQLALQNEMAAKSVVLRTERKACQDEKEETNITYLDVIFVEGGLEALDLPQIVPLESKRFFFKKPVATDPLIFQGGKGSNSEELLAKQPLVEVTVARTFPSILSRQRVILTSEISQSLRDKSTSSSDH